MKTLNQLEPRQPISSIGYNITAPGSYYVTTNLTGITNGIVIAADNVTLDLGGFTLTGSGLYTGIVLLGTHTNIVIRDGTVTKFGAGINAISANDSRFERLKVFQCSNGFDAGTNAILADCSVTGCSYGINTGPKAVLRHCYANNNTGVSVAGIWTGENSVIESCRATANTGTYVSGIIAMDGTTVTDCSASSNSWNGIYLGVGTVAKNCSAYYNLNVGLYGSQGSVISGCSVVGNAEEGIFTYYGTIVIGCNADSNGTGIYVSYNCQILNNNCSKNGASAAAKGSGIQVGGSPNRIEGNNVTGNYYGIQVISGNAANNLIIRNSASGNTTNYVFSSAVAGTVVTSATINSSSNPNANFSY